LQKLKKKIDAIQKLKNESQGERSKTIERLKQITQELKKCFADKNISITESKGLNNELKEHRSIIKDLREKLKYKNYKDPNFISSNLAHLDDDIKSQENTLNTGTHNGQQERAIVNIIDSKKRTKKELRDSIPRIDRILLLEPKSEALQLQIDGISDKIVDLKEEEAKIRASDPSLDKPGEQRGRNPVLDELYEKKRELNEKKKKEKEGYQGVKQQVKEAFQKWVDEDKEKKKVEKEQKKIEIDKYYEDKRKKREERVAEEEKQVPMEDELEISNRLIQLLESFLPAQPNKDSSAPSEPVAKGRGVKKSKGSDINYQWQDFAAFERVGLAPPTSRELIPKAVEELKGKREHYKHVQEEFKKTQDAKKQAQVEANKKAAEEKAAQKAAPVATTVATVVATTTENTQVPPVAATTTTPATEITPAVTEEKPVIPPTASITEETEKPKVEVEAAQA